MNNWELLQSEKFDAERPDRVKEAVAAGKVPVSQNDGPIRDPLDHLQVQIEEALNTLHAAHRQVIRVIAAARIGEHAAGHHAKKEAQDWRAADEKAKEMMDTYFGRYATAAAPKRGDRIGAVLIGECCKMCGLSLREEKGPLCERCATPPKGVRSGWERSIDATTTTHVAPTVDISAPTSVEPESPGKLARESGGLWAKIAPSHGGPGSRPSTLDMVNHEVIQMLEDRHTKEYAIADRLQEVVSAPPVPLPIGTNVYANPGVYGLSILYEVNFGDEHEWDKHVLWVKEERVKEGRTGSHVVPQSFFYGHNHGDVHGPPPFWGVGPDDLEPLTEPVFYRVKYELCDVAFSHGAKLLIEMLKALLQQEKEKPSA